MVASGAPPSVSAFLPQSASCHRAPCLWHMGLAIREITQACRILNSRHCDPAGTLRMRRQVSSVVPPPEARTELLAHAPTPTEFCHDLFETAPDRWDNPRLLRDGVRRHSASSPSREPGGIAPVISASSMASKTLSIRVPVAAGDASSGDGASSRY